MSNEDWINELERELNNLPEQTPSMPVDGERQILVDMQLTTEPDGSHFLHVIDTQGYERRFKLSCNLASALLDSIGLAIGLALQEELEDED